MIRDFFTLPLFLTSFPKELKLKTEEYVIKEEEKFQERKNHINNNTKLPSKKKREKKRILIKINKEEKGSKKSLEMVDHSDLIDFQHFEKFRVKDYLVPLKQNKNTKKKSSRMSMMKMFKNMKQKRKLNVVHVQKEKSKTPRKSKEIQEHANRPSTVATSSRDKNLKNQNHGIFETPYFVNNIGIEDISDQETFDMTQFAHRISENDLSKEIESIESKIDLKLKDYLKYRKKIQTIKPREAKSMNFPRKENNKKMQKKKKKNIGSKGSIKLKNFERKRRIKIRLNPMNNIKEIDPKTNLKLGNFKRTNISKIRKQFNLE